MWPPDAIPKRYSPAESASTATPSPKPRYSPFTISPEPVAPTSGAFPVTLRTAARSVGSSYRGVAKTTTSAGFSPRRGAMAAVAASSPAWRESNARLSPVPARTVGASSLGGGSDGMGRALGRRTNLGMLRLVAASVKPKAHKLPEASGLWRIGATQGGRKSHSDHTHPTIGPRGNRRKLTYYCSYWFEEAHSLPSSANEVLP